jgi:hypothetical protein
MTDLIVSQKRTKIQCDFLIPFRYHEIVRTIFFNYYANATKLASFVALHLCILGPAGNWQRS